MLRVGNMDSERQMMLLHKMMHLPPQARLEGCCPA